MPSTEKSLASRMPATWCINDGLVGEDLRRVRSAPAAVVVVHDRAFTPGSSA
jgi:hypothetical protein